LHIEPDVWPQYAQRAQTRREHLAELQAWLNLTLFSVADYRRFIHQLAELAQQTDRGIVLAEKLVEMLRQQRIILPAIDVIERLCGEALTRGTRQIYKALTAPLSDHHRSVLDGLLTLREGTKGSGLIWLRQPPGPPKPKHILVHLERLKAIRELSLPEGLEHAVHQNRMLKLAREGGQMTAQHLRDLEHVRHHHRRHLPLRRGASRGQRQGETHPRRGCLRCHPVRLRPAGKSEENREDGERHGLHERGDLRRHGAT
jgi:hypothetical protein